MTELNNAIQEQLGAIRVYCGGGAGIGIGKYFEAERGKANPGYATLEPAYIDTSKASTFDVPQEHFYHVQEKDGSGGIRAENATDIMRRTKEILQKFPPLEMNIAIGSTTGGSGSVIIPSIVSELLERGCPVIVFAIGGDDSLQYLKNTEKTLLSYEQITKTRGKPVVLQYLQNGIDGNIEQVDLKVHVAVSSLLVLFSKQNKNLDSKDLFNWLNFDRVTSYAPQIGVLNIQQKELKDIDDNLISLVTLNGDLNNTKVKQAVEYQRVGVPLKIEDAAEHNLSYPLHFAITDGFLDGVVKRIRNQISAFGVKAEARVVRNQLSTGNENVSDNGLVL